MDGHIHVYTRTGGGNREYYENCTDGPSNNDLRAVGGYVADEDDDFDCTFATFRFAAPEGWSRLALQSEKFRNATGARNEKVMHRPLVLGLVEPIPELRASFA